MKALQVISAVLLTSEPVTIHNVPNILDVKNLIDLLRAMNVKVEKIGEHSYRFQADDLDEDYISSADFVARCAGLRGSVLVVGPLLARLGQSYFAKPGGDKIGRRKVDTHISGLSKLGAMIAYNEERQAYYLVTVNGLKGCYILLDEASVTGTANIIMAASLAEGTTTITMQPASHMCSNCAECFLRWGLRSKASAPTCFASQGRTISAERTIPYSPT